MATLSHWLQNVELIEVPLAIVAAIVLTFTVRAIGWSPLEKMLIAAAAFCAGFADQAMPYDTLFDVLVVLLEAVLIILPILRYIYYRR